MGKAKAKGAAASAKPRAPATESKARVEGAKRASASQPQRPAPDAKLLEELRSLGALSVGHPHEGFLVNGAEMPRSPEWTITVPSHAFATEETIASLSLCIRAVHAQFPESAAVMLGSLSAQGGGLLPPHKSHRTGRDADVYFFRKPGAKWSRAATEADIDLPRTWALLRCFITDTDVEMILIDQRVQRWLEAHALSIGEPAEWIRSVFHDSGNAKTAVVRHVPGHVAHMHVRFVSPRARRAAVKVYDQLVAAGLVVPPKQEVRHRVVAGDTLSELAQRHGCTVAAIQELNALRSTVIKVGQQLTLSQAVDVRGARDAVHVPLRRLPPAWVTPRTEAEAQRSSDDAHRSGERAEGAPRNAASRGDAAPSAG